MKAPRGAFMRLRFTIGKGRRLMRQSWSPERDMALARAAVPDRDNILSTLDILRPRQLHDERLVQRWQRGEVEAVEAFNGREPRRLDAPLDHAALAIDQLLFGETQQVPCIIDTLGGALPCLPVILPQAGPQLQRLQVRKVGSFRAFR